MPDWPPIERLGFEAEAIGFHLTAHPLDAYAPLLRRLGAVASDQAGGARRRPASAAGEARRLRDRPQGARRPAPAAGWPGCGCPTRRGSCEVTFFSEVLSALARAAGGGIGVLVTADLRLEGEALRITAQDVAPLDQAAADAGAGMRIWLGTPGAVPHIRTMLGARGPGPRPGGAGAAAGRDRRTWRSTLPGGFKVTPRLARR